MRRFASVVVSGFVSLDLFFDYFLRNVYYAHEKGVRVKKASGLRGGVWSGSGGLVWLLSYLCRVEVACLARAIGTFKNARFDNPEV